jgi:hypothetical protein
MGFAGYRVGLAFVHKGVVAESEHFVRWRHVGFLEKGCSMDWVWKTHYFLWLVIDSRLRLPPNMGVPPEWNLFSSGRMPPSIKVPSEWNLSTDGRMPPILR